MNQQPEDKTTKVGAGTKDVDLKTVSPTGHEEVEAHIASEAKGDHEAPKPLDSSGEKEEETPPVHQTQNPKHPG